MSFQARAFGDNPCDSSARTIFMLQTRLVTITTHISINGEDASKLPWDGASITLSLDSNIYTPAPTECGSVMQC
jgi:hypothetical protein